MVQGRRCGFGRIDTLVRRKANRAQSTANEHDQYAWSFNEYAKRQGFGSFLVRCGEGERAPRSSGTGRLKPTYDDKGALEPVPI